jgi:NAD-dependent dihydropyrimidine dehydrogenase PreA subunit
VAVRGRLGDDIKGVIRRRRFMAIDKIDPEKCTGCGTCVDICTMDVIRMNDIQKKAEIIYAVDCMTCFSCEVACPVGAIHINAEEKAPLSWA